MRARVWLMILAACFVGVVGCSDAGDGPPEDPTPPGETNTIEDMSPEALQDMENVGEPQ